MQPFSFTTLALVAIAATAVVRADAYADAIFDSFEYTHTAESTSTLTWIISSQYTTFVGGDRTHTTVLAQRHPLHYIGPYIISAVCYSHAHLCITKK
ncbi:hypothetical protein BX661DRAFT_189548 [Kickxella alabastrina]|uniref:uncharacterized protein n=1 Tax=Kickxella alabastrina TaxID=61397 RepID=UPI00221EF7FF|nr:uncharacterized protein BX661DRAFT_189548 [Kickxella alabastrina]KAI7820080.1 hypothetical protein BX661DRAFT_189548 [Kickxella alabastrina]